MLIPPFHVYVNIKRERNFCEGNTFSEEFIASISNESEVILYGNMITKQEVGRVLLNNVDQYHNEDTGIVREIPASIE